MKKADQILFPPREIPSLGGERGIVWHSLIKTLEIKGPNSVEEMGFLVFMSRLNTCISCNSDSYRAMLGCVGCAKQSLKRFHGTDEELITLCESALQDVLLHLQTINRL